MLSVTIAKEWSPEKKYEFPCKLSLIETSSGERMNAKWEEGAFSYMACHARSTVTSPSFSW